MDNEFNKVKLRKEHFVRTKVQTSGDPFSLKPPEKKVAAEPSQQRILKNPVDYTAQRTVETSIRRAEKPSEPVAPARETRRVRSKIAKKQLCIMAIIVPLIVVLTVLAVLFFTGRFNNNSESKPEPEQKEAQVVVEKTYPKETATAIDIAIAETEIQITERGHYRLSGETTYPIIVNAPGEVVIYLNGISVAPTGATALANLSEYPLTLILEDNTTTNLQTNSPDANALYSAGDLIIKGGGTLNATGIDVQEGREYKKEAKINNLKVSK